MAARPKAVTNGLNPSNANFVIGSEREKKNTPSSA